MGGKGDGEEPLQAPRGQRSEAWACGGGGEVASLEGRPNRFPWLGGGRGQEEVRDDSLGVGQGPKSKGAAALHQMGAQVWGPPGAHLGGTETR